VREVCRPLLGLLICLRPPVRQRTAQVAPEDLAARLSRSTLAYLTSTQRSAASCPAPVTLHR
jgi:hypothetical protein